MKRETKTGQEIEIKDLTDDHLTNIFKMIKRIEVEGMTVRSGGGMFPDEYRYDEDTLFGEQIYEQEPIYKEIRKEYERRLQKNFIFFCL